MTDTPVAAAPAPSGFAAFTGFLNHHVNDLTAMATVLTGVVAALPINAETRAALTSDIARVNNSAEEIVASLQNMGQLQVPEVHISESDIVKALGDDNTRAVLSRIVADYMAAHPGLGTATAMVPQAGNAAITAANQGDGMNVSIATGGTQDETGQTGNTGAGAVGNGAAPAPVTGA